MRVIIPVQAAPVIPKRGIKTKLRIILIVPDTIMTLRKTNWCPVIFIKIPVEPEIELTNWPITKRAKAGYAVAYG